MPAFPPGPPDSFLGLAHVNAMRADFVGYCARLHATYGDVVFFRLGPHPAYLFLHPDHLADVLVRKARSFRKPARLRQVFSRFEGDGLILSDGDAWSRRRRLVQPAFSPGRVSAYEPVLRGIADAAVATWADGAVIDVYEEMMSLTLRMLARVLFSTAADDDVSRLSRSVRVFHRWAIDQLNRVIPTPSWWPNALMGDVGRAVNDLDAVVRAWIAERRSTPDAPDDLLGLLLKAHDAEGDGRAFTDRELRDELVTILLAGQESTAAGLTWAVWLLATHPEYQSSTDPAAVFREALRLYPPVYSFSREAAEPVEVAGYVLPAGAMAFVCPYLTHRDARWYPEPDRFDPARPASDLACAWLPFGAGPRGCVGKGLATAEAVAILGAIRSRWRIEPAQAEPEREWQLSLRPKGGLRVRVSRAS